MSVISYYDVVIAGAGPVGLLLACELRLGGASVLVLERETSPANAVKALPFGMRGLSAPSLAALSRRGLLAPLMAGQDGSPAGAHWLGQSRAVAGHFAGIPFFHDRIDRTQWTYLPDGPTPLHLATTTEQIESVLATRAVALGADIRRGVAVRALTQSDHGVAVQTDDAVFHGAWLVGCDGGRSAVRKAAGFEFAGTQPEFTGYSVLLELDDPDKLAPGRHYTPTGVYTYQRPGTLALVDFDGGACHRMQPISAAHVESVVRRITGADVRVLALTLATTWTDRACQAAAYRHGRVLLAGDAAHTHSPLGGQGLNLGLGDAMNLGWKLAATIRGDAPDGLLDTYFDERQPVGARVLDWSRAQVGLMRPSPSSRALAAIMRDLVETRDGATYFAERVWGVSARHERGAAHDLVGFDVPDMILADGTRCGSYFTTGQGLLLDLTPHQALAALARRWPGRLRYVATPLADAWGLSALLVRPDGIVAWASDGAPDEQAAFDAIVRWFGKPALPVSDR